MFMLKHLKQHLHQRIVRCWYEYTFPDCTNKFHQILIRTTLKVKVSYSCMPSMKAVIRKHNKKLLAPPPDNANRTNIIYEAATTSDLLNYQEKKCIGLCESIFQETLCK